MPTHIGRHLIHREKDEHKMAKNESSKSKAELYREERKERLAKAAKKNAKNVKARTTAVAFAKKAVAALVIIAIVGGIGWAVVDHFGIIEKYSTALSVGNEKVSVAEYNYYYTMAYQSYAQAESSYQQQGISSGFPLDKAPDEASTGQKDDDGNIIYYDDVVADYAANLAFQQLAIYIEAKDADYKLNEDEQKQIDEAIDSLREQAKSNSYSLNAFIRANYSKGLSEKGLRKLLERELIATRFNNDLETKADESITEQQVTDEYKKDTKTYNYVDTRFYGITLEALTKAASESDEEFKARKAEADKVHIDAANAILEKVTDAETFKTAALEHKNSDLKEGTKPTEADPTVENIGSTYSALKTSLSEEAANWIFDAARKAGDKKVFTTEKAVYVVLVNTPAYEGISSDVRHCLIKFDVEEGKEATDEIKMAASKKVNEVKDEWLKAGGTEAAFKEIVKKYNDDTASNENGGLYEDIRPNSNYVAEFKAWATNPARKTGDYEIVETEFGYHLMYYVKSNGPDWQLTVREKLQSDAYSAEFEALIGEEDGKYKMVENEANIEKASKEFCDKIRTNLAQKAA